MPAINVAASPLASIKPPASANGTTEAATDQPTAAPFSAVLKKQMTSSEGDSGTVAANTANATTDKTVVQDTSQATLPPLLLGSNELAEWVAANFGTAKPAPDEDAPASAPQDPMLVAPAIPVAITPTSTVGTPATAESTASASLHANIAAIVGKDAGIASASMAKSATDLTAEDGSPLTANTANGFAALTNAMGRTMSGTATAATAANTPAIVAVSSEIGTATAKPVLTTPNSIDATLLANHDPNANAAAAALAQANPGSHTTASAERIDTPVGAAGWANDVGNRVAWMANNQQGRAELVLTPPQFGRIEISLTVTGDQATALFVSANPAVRETLEGALPRLREILADAGITLGQAQVGSESPGQSANNNENGDNSRRGANAGFIGEVASTRASANAVNPWSTSGRSMVDVFA